MNNEKWYLDHIKAATEEGLPLSMGHSSIILLWMNGEAIHELSGQLNKKIENAVISGQLKAIVLLRSPGSEAGHSELPATRWRFIKDGVYDHFFVSYEINREDFREWLVMIGAWPVDKDCHLSYWWKHKTAPNQSDNGPQLDAVLADTVQQKNTLPLSIPGHLRVIVDDINEQVRVVADQGGGEQRTYSRNDMVGKGTVTWKLLVDFAKCKGSLEGNTIADVKKRNTSINRKNLGNKLKEALGLDKSPIVNGRNGVMIFASITLAGDKRPVDALDRKTVSMDDQATAFLASHGEDMPAD